MAKGMRKHAALAQLRESRIDELVTRRDRVHLWLGALPHRLAMGSHEAPVERPCFTSRQRGRAAAAGQPSFAG